MQAGRLRPVANEPDAQGMRPDANGTTRVTPTPNTRHPTPVANGIPLRARRRGRSSETVASNLSPMQNADATTRPETVPARNNESRVRWLLAFLVAVPLQILNCGWIAHSEMTTGVT